MELNDPMRDDTDWRLKRELRLSQSEAQAWKERALASERELNDRADEYIAVKKERDALLVQLEAQAEELAQSHYYRECRDYWRTQAESLAAMVDRHNRQVHNAMSHEQLFQPPVKDQWGEWAARAQDERKSLEPPALPMDGPFFVGGISAARGMDD